ncbi:glucose-6-phosphate isomerase [Aminiphilus sp.]|uniref:glucose-6-phosphate isomerase n=1 Tax=Aminiphilus sp. TaxID=1872488 RepID=UPI002612D08F|nr:glucose-6-phosphate isomerase [Aminiphilus sp.]
MDDERLLRLAYGSAHVRWGDAFGGMESACMAAEARLREGAERNESGFGWLCLPYADQEECRAVSRWLASFDAVVQIGIGGSALGTFMLAGALLHPFHNELPREKRGGPRLYVADNVDPGGLQAIWDVIDPAETVFVVASKSGSTAETMANFLWFYERLRNRLGEEAALARILVLTDPEKGTLRSFVSETRCRTLPVPPSVGGRFSVLSCVGLAAAEAVGIDTESLLAGARAMDARIVGASGLADNPSWILAALHVLAFRDGRNMAVFMPYADGLRDFSEWFAQLWGESLGKANLGSTPVRALGAIDQHSQLQLYMSGPDDKLYTLVDVERHRPGLAIPAGGAESLAPLAYLAGKDFGEMLRVEARATASALVKAGRPLLWLQIPVLDAYRLGALIFLFEHVTACAGFLLGIDPFDQPGVEQGKRYIYGLMGRNGFEDETTQVERHEAIMMSRMWM